MNIKYYPIFFIILSCLTIKNKMIMVNLDNSEYIIGDKRKVRGVVPKEIYSVKPYYKRVMRLLKENRKIKKNTMPINGSHIKAFFKSIFILGIIDKGRFQYWRLFFWSLFNNPKSR